MAVQTKMQQETPGYVDEPSRDDVAVEATSEPVATPTALDENAGDTLLALLEKSAQTLLFTAESVENRGLKLLLKVIAQERASMYNSLRQAMGCDAANPLDPARKPISRSLQEGFEEIQTSMAVQMQERENVALTHLLGEEDALVAAYSSFTTENNDSPLDTLLETQQTQIAKFDARLKAVGDGIEPIVARVFNRRDEGDIALKRLQESGFALSQIDSATIRQVERPILQSTAVPVNPKSTMGAGALAGGIVGALVGAALAVFVWLAPDLVGWVTVGPWALFISAVIIGAVFGVVFGFFIGQNQVEDDLMVTADGLENGEILVVAYPRPDQVTMAEEILQIYHARELSR